MGVGNLKLHNKMTKRGASPLFSIPGNHQDQTHKHDGEQHLNPHTDPDFSKQVRGKGMVPAQDLIYLFIPVNGQKL